MRIGLLGGVHATTGNGAPIDVGSAKTQTLLAALALSPGTPLPQGHLVELVWGDAPPRTAYKTLQWHVARLRKGLGGATIVRVGDAYRLDVPPDAVDVGRFQRHLRDGDAGGALAHWGGAPLAGLDAPGLAAAVAGLTEQWLGAVEADLEHRAAADPRATLGDVAEFAERHPLRESAWALLMTALYRVGRQADALAAFRRARQHLVAELGVEPGPALRAVEARVLAHDESLRQRVSVEPDRAAAGAGMLPLAAVDLIGRGEDLRATVDALRRSPAVTLVGPGGIGKTQLALAAARTVAAAPGRPCDVWVVELAGISAPSDAARAAADALRAEQRPGQSLTESVVAALRSRPALLMVDNCEHVVDGAAALVQAIVDGCPRVRVLATSRERLAVTGEQVLVVGPLDKAAGAELFDARALAADRTYEPQPHRAAVDELCRRLDGIPLAIELAAARTVSHRPADLLARLDGPLGLEDHLRATGARRTGAARHRTLRAAIQWSYDLLTPDEQAVFGRLSVFTAPFDLSAAEAVAAADALDDAVDDVLGSLVERSMLTVSFGPAGRRFRLLETVRQFAAGQLRERGAADVATGSHARWYAREAARIGAMLTGPGEADGVAGLADVWPHLRAALMWACAGGDLDLADALVRPVVTELPLRGRQELGDWAERILALTSPGDADRRAFWLVWAAERHTQHTDPDGHRRVAARFAAPGLPLSRWADAYATGDGETLRECLPDAVADLHRRGEPFLAAFLEMTSAGPLLGVGRFDQVDASVGALADRYRTAGPPTLLHWALQTLGYSAAFQGRSDDAERHFDEAARVDVPTGTLSANKTTEARSAFRRGERRHALLLLLSYVDEMLDFDNVVAASVVAVDYINMTAALDRLDEAAEMLGYLAAANEFGAMAARNLVPQASRITATAATAAHADGGADDRLDDRAALLRMRDVLTALTAP